MNNRLLNTINFKRIIFSLSLLVAVEAGIEGKAHAARRLKVCAPASQLADAVQAVQTVDPAAGPGTPEACATLSSQWGVGSFIAYGVSGYVLTVAVGPVIEMMMESLGASSYLDPYGLTRLVAHAVPACTYIGLRAFGAAIYQCFSSNPSIPAAIVTETERDGDAPTAAEEVVARPTRSSARARRSVGRREMTALKPARAIHKAKTPPKRRARN